VFTDDAEDDGDEDAGFDDDCDGCCDGGCDGDCGGGCDGLLLAATLGFSASEREKDVRTGNLRGSRIDDGDEAGRSRDCTAIRQRKRTLA
jgi:hypothetical protein